MTQPDRKPKAWHQSLNEAWQALLFVVLVLGVCAICGWAVHR